MRIKPLLALLLLSPGCWGQTQYTTVTGTVKDSNGCVYSTSGTGRAVFVPGAGGTTVPLLSGSTFQTVVPITALTSAGTFSVVLADNSKVVPASSQWKFSFCALNASTVNTCFAGPTITISGASQDITTSITPLAGLLNCQNPYTNPMTTLGDLTVGGALGAASRLAVGTETQALLVGSGIPTWTTLSGAATKGTDYTVLPADNRKLLVYTGVDTRTFTLPTVASIFAGFTVSVLNQGSTVPLLAVAAPAGGATLNGGASISLGPGKGATIYFDGTNFWAQGGSGLVDTTTTTGDMLRGAGPTALPVRIPIGTAGQVLTVSGGQPTWATEAFPNPMTTLGDVITGGSSGTPGRLGIGSTGNVLQVTAGAPAWGGPPALDLLTVNTGFALSTGMQYIIGTSCTTDATPNNACSTTITWPVTWPDTNYGMICQTVASNGNTVLPIGTISFTTTTAVVQFQNDGHSVPSHATFLCLAFHKN